MTIITCDECGSTNVKEENITKPEVMTMKEAAAKRGSGVMSLVYRPQRYRLSCKDCGYSVEYGDAYGSSVPWYKPDDPTMLHASPVVHIHQAAAHLDRISTPCDDPCRPLGFEPDDYPFR